MRRRLAVRCDLPGLRLEHVDEQLADGLALDLRVGDAGERRQELRLRLHVDERDVVAVAKQRHHLAAFTEAQQAVIDKHAGELVVDRLMDQHGRDGGVDAARQAADHPAGADLAADFLDRLVPERPHGPVAGAARDVAHEIAQQRGAVGRMRHFEMELGGVEFALLVRDRGDRRVGGRGDGVKALRRLGDPVAMAHPHRIFLALAPHAIEQRAILGHLYFGAAEFAMMAALDLAAKLVRHGLLAIADAEHGQASPVKFRRRQRGVGVKDRGGTAGEDHGPGLHRRKGFARPLERRDLAIDALFAHAPGDQLRDLGTEIDDQDLVVHRGRSPKLNGAASRVCGAEAAMCGAPFLGSSPASNGPRLVKRVS